MCLRTIDRKMTLNLIVIFNSVKDISFLKYFTKISTKKIASVLSVLIVLSSEGANQLQVLYIRTLGSMQGNFLHHILFYLSCGHQDYPQQFFFSGNKQQF